MDEPIAVIGLDARFPGDGDTAERFYESLLAGRSARTEVPPERYNADVTYHPDGDRCGSTRVRHGHFLKGSISAFDAPFFSITPTEASSIDPQQRGVLECVYKALENAGIPLTVAAGSQTGVYVGCFSTDYNSLTEKDLDIPMKYAATGNVVSMLSNRVSWFYDFKGPSMTIDTACSSSLVAAHQACMSLKLRETSMAIVGGCNLIISPEFSLKLDKAGVLSPDATSYSFDHRANGYSRGEGFGVVVLKRVSDAIRDGDTIRAVIRNTASNQDGRSPGITQPTRAAQAELIRQVYSRASLDPSLTRFFEAHGTGTAIGDPIEASAIGDVFAPHRSPEHPLYVGALKSNVGHLEGAAGVAAIIKGIYTLERGIIPANTWFEKRNPNIQESWNLDFPTKALPWPQSGLRRMSLNSFGVGGANAHMVMDDAFHFLKQYHRVGNHQTVTVPKLNAHVGAPYVNGEANGSRSPVENASGRGSPSITDEGYTSVEEDDSARAPQLYVLSSYDEDGVTRLRDSYSQYLLSKSAKSLPLSEELRFLRGISYTLAHKRTHHSWRSFSVADSQTGLQEALTEKAMPVRAVADPRLVFIFTGQGAQWPAMGRELMAYPVFQQSLYAADEYLNGLGCSWSLTYELCKDVNTSRVDDAEFSQPLCTALQVAMVDLLASWDIFPHALAGHSSGEIAAAYAAGHISRESAWGISYYRGKLCAKLSSSDAQPKTGMVAVALDKEETIASIARVNGMISEGVLEIACMNSQDSHTVSGDMAKVDALVDLLTSEGTFARKLKVEMAYHSRHMEQISEEYLRLIGDIHRGPAQEPRETQFFSSLLGTLVSPSTLQDAGYWVANLVSPVRFYEAVNEMFSKPKGKPQVNGHEEGSASSNPITDILEIGPHSALKGPLRTILAQVQDGDKVKYHSILRRKEMAVNTSLEAAASLWCRGYDVNLLAVNKSAGSESHSVHMLTDLPSYPFNHANEYWYESRLSRARRFPKVGRHELLGAPVPDWNKENAIWRNYIRLSENPWIEDHKVAGDILYPAAGMLVMAVEASRQVADATKVTKGFRFKDVSFHMALQIPADSQGVESHFYLRPWREATSTAASAWNEFQLFTVEGEEWREHCRGLVQTEYQEEHMLINDGFEDRLFREKCIRELKDAQDTCAKNVPTTEIYKALRDSGYDFGPVFQTLSKASLGPALSAVAEVQSTVRSIEEQMPYQYLQPHLLHPSTLDGVLQANLVAPTFASKRSGRALVPYYAKELWISSEPLGTDSSYIVSARGKQRGLQKSETSFTALCSATRQPMIYSSGFVFMSVPGKDLSDSQNKLKHLAFNIDWKPDPTFPDSHQHAPMAVKDEPPAHPLPEYEELSLAYIRRFLESGLVNEVDDMKPHYKKYLTWMKHITENSPQKPEKVDTQEFERRIEATDAPEGKLIVAVGQALQQILSGEVDPLEVFFSGKLAEEFYRNGFDAERCYSQLRDYVDVLTHKDPAMEFLEIGGGTGGATKSIMQTLGQNGPRYQHYDFTDLSPAFFEEAQEVFSDHIGRMSFRTLNVEKDPIDQGFEGAKYDVIIAANVLHATKNIDATLQNVRKLLKPGGKFLLYEVTNVGSVSVTLIFGTLSGWWFSEDPDRVWGPLMAVDNWKSHLSSAGFSGLDAVFHDFPDPADQVSSVLVSTASMPDQEPLDLGPALIVAQGSSLLQRDIAKRLLASLGQDAKCEIVDIPAVQKTDLANSTCIVLSELETPILRDMSEQVFAALKRMTGNCKTILWATRSGNPDLALVTGLARAVRAEKLGLNFVTVFFEQDASAEAIVEKAAQILRGTSDSTDSEFRVIEGSIQIPRVVVADHIDDYVQAQTLGSDVVEAELGQDPMRPLALQIGDVARLDTLRFEDDPLSDVPLAEHEVEYKIMACGMNLRDLATVLGQVDDDPILGMEASGIVTRVGSAAAFKVGDRVYGLSTSGAMKTQARCEDALLASMPESMSWTEAASIPFVYSAAYAILFELGSVHKGDTILIHSAAGEFGQAATQVALHQGAEVFATVGTPEERDFLEITYKIPQDHIFSNQDLSFKDGVQRMTRGRGVDTVINSLTGNALRATWDCVAPFGRFVELGIKDIFSNASLAMGNFERNVRFESFDLVFLAKHDPLRAQRIFQRAMRFIIEGGLVRATPITVLPFSKIQEAFRSMQGGKHIGKVVCEAHDHDVVPIVPSRKPKSNLDPDATYVIAGGLGGIGRSVSRWIASRGAKNLILLSRRGPVNDSAMKFVDELKLTCDNVATPACDAADREALQKAIDECLAYMPKIKGCIQGSLVLKDNRFEDMALDEWEAAIRPKVDASWNLHEVLGGDLDFFVLLSSMMGIMGNQDQSNYAAGNTFKDALARWRVSQGLPAVSLDLPVVEDVGYVAAKPALLESMRAAGFETMTEEEIHAVLDYHCNSSRKTLHPIESQVVLRPGLPHDLAAAGIATPSWMHGPLFTHLAQIETGAVEKVVTKEEVKSAALLAAASSISEVEKVVLDALLLKLSRVLSVDLSNLDPAKPLHAYGVDSLVAVDVRSWLSKELGSELSVFEMTNKSSINQLAGAAAAKSRFAPAFAEGGESKGS